MDSWTICFTFPRSSSGSWTRSGVASTWTAALWEAQLQGCSLTHYAVMLELKTLLNFNYVGEGGGKPTFFPLSEIININEGQMTTSPRVIKIHDRRKITAAPTDRKGHRRKISNNNQVPDLIFYPAPGTSQF